MLDMTKRRLTSLAVALMLTSLAPGATAQSSADKAAAEALFQAGRDLMGSGKFAEACPKFEASQRLDAGLGTLLFLADCYEKANRLASAWATFREAESIAMGRSDQPRAQVAKQRYGAIEPRLSKLWIKVADGNDAATEVKRDGAAVPRESWGLALPTDAGEHTIQASAPGRKPWSTKIVVAGEATSVPVDVPVLEVAPEEPSAPARGAAPLPAPNASDQPNPPVSHTQRTLSFVLGGVGVASLGVGTYFTIRANSKNNQSHNRCEPNSPNLCSQEGVDLRNQALSAARLGTAFMIGGGVLLASGVVLYLTSPSEKPSTFARDGLRLAAGPTPSGGHVSLGGTW